MGTKVVQLLLEKETNVRSVVRSRTDAIRQNDFFFVESVDSATDWSGAFEDIDCVVHCAARVHQMNETQEEAEVGYGEVNTLGTLHLAQEAAKAGVKRFVFVSSIKVNGEFTLGGHPFTPTLESKPSDPYGLSKYEAEIGLKQVAQDTGLEVVIVRPPLVYGEGVKANFLSMMSWLKKEIPLPLGSIHNQRSLVYVDNLANLIVTCCSHPKAPNQTFLVSDDFDVSTTQLLRQVSSAMSVKARLLPVPMSWFKLVASLIRKPQIAQRLCGNLQVDISHTKNTLDWIPPVRFEEGIKRTVQAYLDSESVGK